MEPEWDFSEPPDTSRVGRVDAAVFAVADSVLGTLSRA